jgi:phasin family protein
MSAQLKIAGPTDAIAKAQIQIQESFRAAMKQTEGFMAFGHGNFDAIVKCNEIWTTGVQELAKQLAASAQASLDETLATFKAFSSIKSPQEALELQTKLVGSAWEKTAAESGRISEASVKLFQEALAPLTARATAAAEKLSKAA